MVGWIQAINIIRKIGIDLILPLVKEIHDNNEEAAKERLNQALTAQASGRAASEASKNAGRYPDLHCSSSTHVFKPADAAFCRCGRTTQP